MMEGNIQEAENNVKLIFRNKAQDFRENTALSIRVLRKPTIKWWACFNALPISSFSTGLIQVCFHASYEWKAINKGERRLSWTSIHVCWGFKNIAPSYLHRESFNTALSHCSLIAERRKCCTKTHSEKPWDVFRCTHIHSPINPVKSRKKQTPLPSQLFPLKSICICFTYNRFQQWL